MPIDDPTSHDYIHVRSNPIFIFPGLGGLAK